MKLIINQKNLNKNEIEYNKNDKKYYKYSFNSISENEEKGIITLFNNSNFDIFEINFILDFSVNIDHINIIINDLIYKVLYKSKIIIILNKNETASLIINNMKKKSKILIDKFLYNNIEKNEITEKVFINKINSYYSKLNEYNNIYYPEKTNEELLSLFEKDIELEYNYFIYNNIEKIREIKNNNYYNAVFIEFKINPQIEFIIRNTINVLGDTWNYTIICSIENYEIVYNICNLISNNITIIKKNIEKEYGEDYNNMLLSISFWEKIIGEKILIYNKNSIILHNNINNFIKYDYIGNENINLRTKSVMIDILKKNINIENSERIEKYKKLYNLSKCPEFIYVKKMINNCAPNYKNEMFSSKKKMDDTIFSICNIFKLSNWKKYIYENVFKKDIYIKKEKKEISTNNNKYNNFEIILINEKIKNDLNFNNIKTSYYNDNFEFVNDKDYLFINGEYNITLKNIEDLYEHFIISNCNILSPVIIKNNILEYFGSVVDNDGFIININENILKYQYIITKIPVYSYVYNTMFQYPNIYIIKNVDNILNNEKFEKDNFIKKSYNYSKKLTNVKVDPFIIINNINNENINDNKIKINYKNDIFPFSISIEYLKDIYNNYTKFNLVSFKFFNDLYYLTLNKKKTILLIEESIITPDKDCGSLYIYYMLITFLKMGFNVHFLPSNFYCDEKYTRILQKMGIYVCYTYPYSISYHLKNNYNVYDYIFVCRLSCMEKSYEYIKKYCHKSKIIFITHDLNFLRNEREKKINNNNNKNSKDIELEYIQKADISVVVSKEEYKILKENEKLINIEYIPICYDLLEDYDRDIKTTNDVYFIGSKHPPNLDAVEFFLKNHWFKIINNMNMNIVFHIIGNGYDELKYKYRNEKSIIFHGFVSDELLHEMIKKFRINIVPLRFGAGIKGKILQSSNLKIPCISSHVGVEGMEMKNGENIIVSDFDDNFYKEFQKYYNDIVLLKKISDNSYNIIKNYYSLEKNEVYIRNLLYKIDNVKL